MKDVRVRSHTRRRVRPVTDRQLQVAPVRDYSDTDIKTVNRLLGEVKSGQRSGYTYTSFFRFDIDDPQDMKKTYDRVGDRVMYVIAETNRPADELYFEPIVGNVVIGPTQGIGLWRNDKTGVVYADNIRLYFGIDDQAALAIAQRLGQESILKVDGRSRSSLFLPVPVEPLSKQDLVEREAAYASLFELESFTKRRETLK